MKRLIVLAAVLVLIVAACGEADPGSIPTAGESGRAAAGETSTAHLYEPDLPPTAEDEVGGAITATANPDEAELAETATPVGTQPGDSPYPNPTPEPTTPPGAPTASPTATISIDPSEIPTLPPVPEVTSCDQAADLVIERLQIWLDALGLVPEEVMLDDARWPTELDDFIAEMNQQMGQIENDSRAIGCEDEEMQALISGRVDQLEARNINAEVVLEMLLMMTAEEEMYPETPTATASATQRPVELDWDIAKCTEVADLFVDRVQLLLYDMSDVELVELSGDEQPEAMTSFEADMERLDSISDELGCETDELNRLVAERVHVLVADGPVAELLLEGILQAASTGEIFQD